MNATDLMVGDLVLLFGETQARVDAIGNTEVYVYEKERGDWHVSYEQIKPIPLTPEILEKNGFKPFKVNENESVEVIGKWWGMMGLILVKQFSLSHVGKVFSVKCNHSRIANVRNVHEFQNALRLCGIEKEIVL